MENKIKLRENRLYKIMIWENEITKDKKIAELDSRRLCEITYYNKEKNKTYIDLVQVICQELRGVYCYSHLEKRSYVCLDFIKMYINGQIKETDYILGDFKKDIIF